MARSMWNGALILQDLVVPVKVFAATEPRAVQFRELHSTDGAPIEHRRVSSSTGKELAADQVVKGYETSPGHHVTLTDEEIHAVDRPERRAIEIETLVPADQVDPALQDRAYYLGAQADGRDVFAGLLAALERSDLVAIGRVVLRTREQLVCVRAGDGVLRMSTMRFADELVAPADLDVPDPARTPTRREVEMAEQLVDGFSAHFTPGTYPDTYHERVEEYARAKAKGKEPELPEIPERQETDDLMAALRASLDTSGPRKRKRKKSETSSAAKTKAVKN